MEIKQLETFKTIVEEGGYQKAAEKLGYTQSTMTIHIQQLEAELGVPLFRRMGRRMTLTTIGQQVLQEAQELLHCAQRITTVAQEGQALTGTLRVDLAETLLCYHFQNVLQRFRALAPQVKLILRNRNPRGITENLRAGICDVGIFYTIDWSLEMLEVETLPAESEQVLVAAPNFAEKDFVTPNRHLHTSFIIDEPDSPFRRQVEEYLRAQNITFDETIELWSTEGIKQCVISNLGFSFLPRSAARRELQEGSLVALPCPLTGSRKHLLIARHKNTWETPAMKLFYRVLREEFAEGVVY